MGQSQTKAPEPAVVDPRLFQPIIRERDFRALADQLNRYRAETGSSMRNISAMTGNPAEIGARRAAAFESNAADYLSSIPRADRYIRETTGVDDPYAASRSSAQSYLDLNKRLSEEAERDVSVYQEPSEYDEEFSWAELPTPGKKRKRKAGQRLS